MRLRTRRIRRTVIAGATSVFIAAFSGIYVQLATGHDPVKAHKNVMTLPKYAALAEMLMPAKF